MRCIRFYGIILASAIVMAAATIYRLDRNAPPAELDAWARQHWDRNAGVLHAHLPQSTTRPANVSRPSTAPMHGG